MPAKKTEKFTSRVRVLRSYDYCHFEVELGSDDPLDMDGVNDLRKKAAMLADEAVRQYQVAREKERSREGKKWEADRLMDKVEVIKAIPETERSAEQTAILRGFEDHKFWKDFHEDDYSYVDNPEREYHFSMLRRFQDSKVKG